MVIRKQHYNFVKLLLYIVAILGFFSSCEKIANEDLEIIESIKLSDSFLVIETGNSQKLDVEVLPVEFDTKLLRWESTDSHVATVQEGTVFAVSDGDVDIKVYYGNLSTSCHVKVVDIYNIAHSHLDDIPENTYPHFLAAVNNGFNGLKADMRITADNKIVLCHDAGYTLNENGQIITFNSQDYTSINTLTEEQVLSLEFEKKYLGSIVHPCSLDDFLEICTRYYLIPYLTFRHDGFEEATASEMYGLLLKYHLEKIAIINLYSYRKKQVEILRKLFSDFIICDTELGSTESNTDLIERMHEAGVRFVCYKYDTTVINTLATDHILFANSLGMQIWSWNVTNKADYDDCIAKGIKGFQVYSRSMW